MENDPNPRTDKSLLEKAGNTVQSAGKTIVEKTKDAAVVTGQVAAATGKAVVHGSAVLAEKGKEAAVATGTAAVAAGKAIAEKTKEGVEVAKDPHTREMIAEKSKEVSDKTKGIIRDIEETAEKAVDFVMGKTEDHSPTAQDLVDKATEVIKDKTEEVADDLNGDDHNET